MGRLGRFSFKGAWAALMGSLEKRLIGALLLIASCTVALHFISQDQAFKLRAESEALRVAASNAERADQLAKAVSEFRLAAHLHIAPSSGNAALQASDALTDAAMQIGNELNALRMHGVALYDLPQGMAAFHALDRHIAGIVEAGSDETIRLREQAGIDRRNREMADLAGAIRARADARRDDAQSQLARSAAQWQMLVALVGVVTMGVIGGILFDLLRNILPAMRRMHTALRRLAAGDLGVEIGEFKLHELQALSGPLETFRRNALAVKNLAFTDPSTGMPNRRAFVEQAGKRIAAGPRPGERGFVVMLADTDRFKHVNDDYGHAAGDRLVKLIGERMTVTLGEGAIIARVGGDEFAICAPLPEGQSPAAMGTRLVADVRPPLDLGAFTVAVTISVGLVETAGGEDSGDINHLLNRADLALYASKNEGRNRATVFSSELEQERELDRALERDLADAFDRGELRVVYQPIHSISGDDGDEVEALVRWRHPVLGEISPARFIPAAERSGLMVQLGAWIIERALGDLARWPYLSMSLNLSPLQLQQEGFVGFLMEACRKNRVPARRVILEVTESLSIERNTRAIVTLNLLRAAGFRIALDDFGTGYSSLCMMKTFKFDRLKLDRSLISDIGKDATSQAVFDAAVTMALRIGAEVVAEGISEERLVEPVRSAGCTHVQGFHYSHPIEAESVESYYLSPEAAERRVA